MEEMELELKVQNVDTTKLFESYEALDRLSSQNSSEEKTKLLETILPQLRDTDTWDFVAEKIFNQIYLDDRYREYTFYLLTSNLVKPSSLSTKQVKNIIEKTSWGFSYVMRNFELILKGYVYPSTLVEILIEYLKRHPESFTSFIEHFLYSPVPIIREELITALVKEELLPNKELIIASLYQNPDDFIYKQETLPFLDKKPPILRSHIPFLMSRLNKENKYQDILENFYELFFEAESKSKLAFAENVKYITENIKEKYQEILRIAKDPMVRISLDLILTTIINAHEESYIIDYIKGQDFSYGGTGTIRKVFKVGEDKVLKFSRSLYDKNSIRHHFLLAPTELRVIDEKDLPTVFIEKQEYLSDSYNGKKITEQDIDNFLQEAEKQGIVIKDHLCLSKSTDNFGFLRDYHDASLVGVDSYDELPEWFKERPLVLYDIDLVSYKNGSTKSLTKTMKD